MVPEQWSELTTEQAANIAYILFTEEEVIAQQVKLVHVLMGANKAHFMQISPEVMQHELFPLTDWLRNEYDLLQNPLPMLESEDGNLYGPADELGNLLALEFDNAEYALERWSADMNNLEPLYEFMAILYRKAKKGYDMVKDVDGDVREVYNPNLNAYNAKIIARDVAQKYIYLVLLWYRACRAKWMVDYAPVFEGDGTDNAFPSSVGGYFPLLRSIAKEGIYGDFDKVCSMPMNTLLSEMLCIKDDADRMERELKKNQQPNGL
jgi:hypothetical protein